MVKALKILVWTLVAVIVLAIALLICVVKFADSERIIRLAEDTVNERIEGRLSIGHLKLGLNPGFPILQVEVEDLTIMSHVLDSLAPAERGLLPNYSDSLLSLSYVKGSLDIRRLIVKKQLALHDVVLRGLSVNLVIAHNGKANYEIMKKTPEPEDKTKKKGSMSGISINRFALEQPREIRFYNAADSTSASVLLLTEASVEGEKEPAYRLRISGNVTSPKATMITNLDNIIFGVNGKVYWDPAQPGIVAMEKMELQGAFVKTVLTGEIDLRENPIIQKGVVEILPVAVTDLLSLLPDSVRAANRLNVPYFSTDAVIKGRCELLKPMNLATDTLPTAVINLLIPPATLSYDKTRFEEIALDMEVKTMTNLPDSTVIDVSRLILNGETTQFNLSASLTQPVTDPSFDVEAHGHICLADFPSMIRRKIPGYISGVVTTDIHLAGNASMLSQEHFHRLSADGDITADNFYFLSGDTTKMVEMGKVAVKFDSQQIVEGMPVLSTKISADTANILVGGVDIAVGALSLNAGAKEKGSLKGDKFLLPLHGKLNVGHLNIISITDSAGGHISNLKGDVTLTRFKENDRITPDIIADLIPGHVSAGSKTDRILLDNTRIKATLRKLPTVDRKVAPSSKKSHREIEYSYLLPEKVIRYVYAKRHRKPGQKRKRRVYVAPGTDGNEILIWDLAKGFSRFLNEWKLKGTLSTRQAKLAMPVFPLRNSFSLIDLNFSNDTVGINNISLQAGKSDILLTGLVTNVRRALTSKTHDTLKGNFKILSDTIDINQLSAVFFSGDQKSSNKPQEKNRNKTREKSPVLIPVNLDANIRLEAKRMLYSDLGLGNAGADILIYDGGVSLHKLDATSDVGSLDVSALYSAASPEKMHFGFGMEIKDFNVGKFVKLVPAIDSIVPLMHDFSGLVSADVAATCRVDRDMNFVLPTLDAAIKVNGDNLAFIDPEKYRKLGKWLGFKNKADNTIKSMNVEITVTDGVVKVYPFVFNIDRYRLGIYGSNDVAMNFNYHISVLKSPLPFKFGINIYGDPKKYKVRFGGAKFKENTAIGSVNIVKNARVNLIDQIEQVFKRGVKNSQFAKLSVNQSKGFDMDTDSGLNESDSLELIRQGIIDGSAKAPAKEPKKKEKKKKRKRFLFF